jgi:protease I
MKRIAAVVDDIYEDLELWYPRIGLEEEGWKVVAAGPEARKVYAGKHGCPCPADVSFADLHAGILRGRRATSTVGIRDDMINAGALWTDEALVVDGNLVSSRTPADLPVFAKGMADWLKSR